MTGSAFHFRSWNNGRLRIVNGSPLDRGTTYTVAANSYLATGGDGFTVFKEGLNQQSLGNDADALEEYVSDLEQPFDPPAAFGSRITSQG